MTEVRNNLILRGLITALSVFLLTGFIGGNLVTSRADTSNDLRESLGIEPNTYGTNVYSHSGVNTQTNKGQSSDDTDQTNPSGGSYIVDSEDSKSEELATYVKIETQIEELRNKISLLEGRLSTRLKNGSNAYIITLTVDEIREYQKEIEDLNSTKLTASDSIPSGKTNVKSTLGYEEEDLQYSEVIKNSFSETEFNEISSLDYDIGYIGDSAPCVVENYFKLVTPWGFTKHASEENYGEKLLGIDLYARAGDKIKAQWNGMIVDISSDDSSELQYIKIYHGNSTYTIYSHVYPIEGIYIGTKVKQGQVIAEAGDTSTSLEQTKDNHIFYQVRLNGEFVNPLLVYGNKGQKVYETWLTSYAYDNVVESDEKYFNRQDTTYKVEEKKEIQDVIFPDFNKEN